MAPIPDILKTRTMPHAAFGRDERMSPSRWFEGVDHAVAEGEQGAINGIVN